MLERNNNKLLNIVRRKSLVIGTFELTTMGVAGKFNRAKLILKGFHYRNGNISELINDSLTIGAKDLSYIKEATMDEAILIMKVLRLIKAPMTEKDWNDCVSFLKNYYVELSFSSFREIYGHLPKKHKIAILLYYHLNEKLNNSDKRYKYSN